MSARQTTAYSNTPGKEERIECKEDAFSTGDIDLDTKGVVITSMKEEREAHGVHAEHIGTADIEMSLEGKLVEESGFTPTTITAKGGAAQGVYANVGWPPSRLSARTFTMWWEIRACRKTPCCAPWRN